MMKNKCVYCAGILSLMITFFVSAIAMADELDKVIEDVRQNYDVEHINNQDFKKLSEQEVVVFDVRKFKEFEVSHLENAVHLDPATSSEEFFKLHADQLKNKVAVFHCSVGQRSSRMLLKLKKQLPTAGVNQAYNLEGGAFKWSNDKIDFVRKDKTTKDVHPYNAYWGRLVNDKNAIKYKAEN
jgi:rhodanese-related sulfurtransferase